MAYKVTKPIPKGDGTVIATGTLVDASKWRNLRSLINGRYLVEVLDVVAPAPKPVVQKPVAQPVAQPVAVVKDASEEEKPRTARKSRKRDESEE